MSPAAWGLIGTVAAAVIGGIVALIVKRIDAHTARTLTPYESIVERVTDLEEKRKEDVATIEAQQTEITGLKRRVNGMIEDRDALLSYVVTLREWVAGGSRPPAPTPPRHLADVLPPWESGDGAETATQEAQ